MARHNVVRVADELSTRALLSSRIPSHRFPHDRQIDVFDCNKNVAGDRDRTEFVGVSHEYGDIFGRMTGNADELNVARQLKSVFLQVCARSLQKRPPQLTKANLEKFGEIEFRSMMNEIALIVESVRKIVCIAGVIWMTVRRNHLEELKEHASKNKNRGQ